MMAASKQNPKDAAQFQPPIQSGGYGAAPSADAPEPATVRAGGVFVAKTTFSYTDDDGVQHIIHKGQTRVREGHSLLAGREGLFEPIELKIDYDVEQATAAPGEKRGQR